MRHRLTCLKEPIRYNNDAEISKTGEPDWNARKPQPFPHELITFGKLLPYLAKRWNHGYIEQFDKVFAMKAVCLPPKAIATRSGSS